MRARWKHRRFVESIAFQGKAMRSKALRQKDNICRTQDFRYRKERIKDCKTEERQRRRLQQCIQILSSSCLLAQRRLWTSEDLETGMSGHPDRPTRPTDEPQQKHHQFRSSSEAPTNVAYPMIQHILHSTTTIPSVLLLQQCQDLNFIQRI